MITPTKSFDSLVVYGHVGFDVSDRAGKVARTVGGAAYYTAMAAAAQGVAVSLVTILGADFPQTALKFGQLDISASSTSPGPSATFTQIYDRKNEVIAFDGKLNVCGDLSPDQIPLRTAEPAAIMLTTAPPSQQESALEWLLTQNFRGLIAIDTNLAYIADFDTFLRRKGFRIGVLFINAAEYEALSYRPPSRIRTVVKRGSQGATIFEGGLRLDVPAPVIGRIRTITGAGDVLAGAFLAAHLRGKSSVEALTLAVTFASSYVRAGVKCFSQDSLE